MKPIKIIASSVKKIEDTGVSIALDTKNNYCALRELDGEVRCIGYVRDYAQFCQETKAGVGFAYNKTKWKLGVAVEFVEEEDKP